MDELSEAATPHAVRDAATQPRSSRARVTLSLQWALLLLIATVLVTTLVLAGVALDRRLARSLEQRAWQDLALAPRVMADRNQARGDVLMMHAKELAGAPDVVSALAARDSSAAHAVDRAHRGSAGEEVILIAGAGRTMRTLVGLTPALALIDSTRGGAMPVAVIADSAGLRRMALAPVHAGSAWIGVAGLVTPLGAAEAGALAGLTRSTVVILGPDGRVVGSMTDERTDSAIVRAALRRPADGRVYESAESGSRWLTMAAPLGGVGTVVFARDLKEELAVLPELRRVALWIGLASVAMSLLLAGLAAARVSAPVRALATAADRLAGGDFSAPLAPSRVAEVTRVAQAFDAMREALAARLDELNAANRALKDRQARLTVLQAELIQRDRRAATGQLVAQLAHEIRNPVANVRNLLELLRRRLAGVPEDQRLADLAIDELLRMHDLAEQMLTLHRPRELTPRRCDAAAVVAEVVALARAGATESATELVVSGAPSLHAAIASDALKQVLVNLVQNAREATGDRGRIAIALSSDGARAIIDMVDDGPGVPPDHLARVFDPFFTTKAAVEGVGLGLFVAEGLVRAVGGRIAALPRDGARGAHFRIELPLVLESDALPLLPAPAPRAKAAR